MVLLQVVDKWQELLICAFVLCVADLRQAGTEVLWTENPNRVNGRMPRTAKTHCRAVLAAACLPCWTLVGASIEDMMIRVQAQRSESIAEPFFPPLLSFGILK